MNAYEFGQQIGEQEKEAAGWAGAAAAGADKIFKGVANTARRGAKFVKKEVGDAWRKSAPQMPVRPQNALSVPSKPTIKIPTPPKPTLLQRAGDLGAAALDEGLTTLDNMGRVTRHYGGKAVDAVKSRFGGGPKPPPMYQQRLRYVNPDERALIPHVAEGSRELAQRPRNFKFYEPPERTWGNIGTGAGVGLGATAALTAVNPFRGDGTSEPSQQNINTQQMGTQLAMGQHAEVNPNSGGLMGMWNSLPIEARYAIGAGVPLALAGAFMGGRGNTGLGAGLGALGLGAAGLGAAGAGMFGDGARRMVGQGANGLYSMLGGGNSGNPMDQINALSQLSPEFGATMLMGRDPNMSSGQARQMYDFLTHNRNIIEQLMPQLQNASTTGVKQGSALEFGKAAGRCWTGYEPVPGKKPYSNDSCRPVGSKKKDKKEKKAVSAAPRGKTEMSCTPSSRGSNKLIDDKQRSVANPVPTDATNAQQTHGEKEAAGLAGAAARGIGMMARGMGRGVAGASRAVSRATGAAAGELGSAAVNRGAQMARGGAEQMMRGGVGNAVGGGLRAATGAGMYGAGQVARGAGNVAQWAGKQVPGSTAMNAARTAVAMPIAAGATYGAYRAVAPAVDPHISAAQQFGSDVGNAVAAVPMAAARGVYNTGAAAAQGIHDTGAAIGNAAGAAYGAARNSVVNTANAARRGVNNAVQTVAAVPRAIGQGIHDTGTAIGDAAGTAYGTARNAVVNTANDVRRGVNNAAQTARSYVPNIRNPFYYE